MIQRLTYNIIDDSQKNMWIFKYFLEINSNVSDKLTVPQIKGERYPKIDLPILTLNNLILDQKNVEKNVTSNKYLEIISHKYTTSAKHRKKNTHMKTQDQIKTPPC